MSTIKQEADKIKEKAEVECPICGVKFVVKRPWQKVCSAKCRQAAYWQVHQVVKREGV
jgi:DNA-directed RNA polymerase subunit RPC12/RpoP